MTLATGAPDMFSFGVDPTTHADFFQITCFTAGTRISTARGEVAVEDLKVGEMVLALESDGHTLRPVRWVGRSPVSRRFGDPIRLLPIRIRAGALAENVPARDLLVSPNHGILIDDVLVQAGALVNGTSVIREYTTRKPSHTTMWSWIRIASWSRTAPRPKPIWTASKTFIS